MMTEKAKQQPISPRQATFYALRIVAAMAVARMIFWLFEIFLREQHTGDTALDGGFCLTYFAAIGASYFYLKVVIVSFRARTIVPIAIVLAGAVMVLRIPMPDKPATPEERYFMEHRDEFIDAAAIMSGRAAIAGQINCRPLPEKYAHLAYSECVEVYTSGGKLMAMLIAPLEYGYYIAYLDENACRGYCSYCPIEKYLDDRWAVCHLDWG